MQKITGKYSEAIVFTDNIESGAIAKMVDGEKVRIMPDVHAGSGCVIGYTQTYKNSGPIDPEVVGVDLGCGVLSVAYKVGSDTLSNLPLLDMRIRKTIPVGMQINDKTVIQEKEFKKFLRGKLEKARSVWPEMIHYEGLGEIEKLITRTCKRIGMDEGTFWKSLGTLGGGEGI